MGRNGITGKNSPPAKRFFLDQRAAPSGHRPDDSGVGAHIRHLCGEALESRVKPGRVPVMIDITNDLFAVAQNIRLARDSSDTALKAPYAESPRHQARHRGLARTVSQGSRLRFGAIDFSSAQRLHSWSAR